MRRRMPLPSVFILTRFDFKFDVQVLNSSGANRSILHTAALKTTKKNVLFYSTSLKNFEVENLSSIKLGR